MEPGNPIDLLGVIVAVIVGLLSNTIFKAVIEPHLGKKMLPKRLLSWGSSILFLFVSLSICIFFLSSLQFSEEVPLLVLILLIVLLFLREMIPRSTEKTKRSILTVFLDLTVAAFFLFLTLNETDRACKITLICVTGIITVVSLLMYRESLYREPIH